jgi:hypothetical protein
MDPLFLVVVAVLVVVAAAIVMLSRRKRTEKLRSHFGPEYEHAVQAHGERSKAEAELAHRAERASKFQIRPLPESDQRFYMESWQRCQARFVDDPPGALYDADRIVCEVMKARGYPVGSHFEERAADLSVEYPRVVQHYRTGHETESRIQQGNVTTEELRTAMMHFRVLFDELVTPAHRDVREPEPLHRK